MKLPRSLVRVLHRVGLGSCFALLAAEMAFGTWSIVAVNTKTGEVCIASATCIEGFLLKPSTSLILVGKGAAACQSLIDSGAINRMKIWNMMQQGLTPQEILARIQAHDSHALVRQYGIVTMDDFPLTFTGPQCGDAKYGTAGVCDDLKYAIQGNVLTGYAVVYYAEQAFLTTEGDLGQKVMAAMEAARSMGGDGRCSCDINFPDHCGSPPPNFVYSSYTAYIALARMGDQDGVCNDNSGCANGVYYLDLQAVSDATGPEPVLALESGYADWRNALHGYADHILTTVTPNAQSLPADGLAHATVDVQLIDVDGHPVLNQPATLQISREYDGPQVARIGVVTDHGQGHYTFDVTATNDAGQGKWKIEVQHTGKTVRLWPDLSIRVDPVTGLHSGYDQLSAVTGGSVPLILNSTPEDAGRPYIVLGTSSGTVPGQLWDGLLLPLNDDALFQASVVYANTAHFPHTAGAFDEHSHAEAAFVASPMLLSTYIGRHFDWCGVIYGASTHFTNVAGFDVVP